MAAAQLRKAPGVPEKKTCALLGADRSRPRYHTCHTGTRGQGTRVQVPRHNAPSQGIPLTVAVKPWPVFQRRFIIIIRIARRNWMTK